MKKRRQGGRGKGQTTRWVGNEVEEGGGWVEVEEKGYEMKREEKKESRQKRRGMAVKRVRDKSQCEKKNRRKLQLRMDQRKRRRPSKSSSNAAATNATMMRLPTS